MWWQHMPTAPVSDNAVTGARSVARPFQERKQHNTLRHWCQFWAPGFAYWLFGTDLQYYGIVPDFAITLKKKFNFKK